MLSRLQSIARIVPFVSEDQSKETRFIQESRAEFVAALLDDFSTGRAINHLFRLVNQVYRQLETQPNFSIAAANTLLHFFNEAGSILFGDLYTRDILPKSEPGVEALVELLLSERTRLRNQKQYQEADAIRTRLEEVGVDIVDTQQCTLWWIRSLNRKKKSRDAH
jgi:cysteinyl-tRNA synthetase